MSETKSLSAPKASFDRRSVVKGAAWSVPVIAAAIAAPAAAASTPPAPTKLSAMIVASPTPPAIPGNPAVVGVGTWPIGFTISTSGAVDVMGTASVTITITPREANTKVGLVLANIDGTPVSSAGKWAGDLLVPASGSSPTFTFAYARTGIGAAPNTGDLTFDIKIDISVFDYATNQTTVMDSIERTVKLKKK